MRINLEEISTRIKEEIRSYSKNLAVDEVGTIVELGDGIARIYGMRRRHGHGDARVRDAASSAWR